MSLISDLEKQVAWATTRPLSGIMQLLHPADARMDEVGNVIRYTEYGKASSQYGWEIDHREPKSLGGSLGFNNLRALKCRTNRQLGGLLGAVLSQASGGARG